MSKEQGNKGFIERSAGFFEKLHYGLGAIALTGAILAPELAAPLILFGAWEVAHGALWGFIKNRSGKKSQPAPA
jgi:hypothetical protein